MKRGAPLPPLRSAPGRTEGLSALRVQGGPVTLRFVVPAFNEERAIVDTVSALREAGLVVRNAICVVDREEGGSDALARLGVRLRALFRAEVLLEQGKTAGKRHG